MSPRGRQSSRGAVCCCLAPVVAAKEERHTGEKLAWWAWRVGILAPVLRHEQSPRCTFLPIDLRCMIREIER